MNNKTLGIVIIVFGGLVLYSEQEYAWVVSAIAIGIGSGIYFYVLRLDSETENRIFSKKMTIVK